MKVKPDDNDNHDSKTTAGCPSVSRGGRKAIIGGSGIGGGSGSDKRRLRASMERLWRVYEVVTKRELQLKGSVDIFNMVHMYSYCRYYILRIQIVATTLPESITYVWTLEVNILSPMCFVLCFVLCICQICCVEGRSFGGTSWPILALTYEC